MAGIPSRWGGTPIAGATSAQLIVPVTELGRVAYACRIESPLGTFLSHEAGVLARQATSPADASAIRNLSARTHAGSGAQALAVTTPRGTALVEIYSAPAATIGPGRLYNISVRAHVEPGNPLIAGFTVTGTDTSTLLIRAVGPALAGFGVPGALANPKLTLFRGGRVIAENERLDHRAINARPLRPRRRVRAPRREP